MINKSDIIKINDYLWEIPKGYKDFMKVSARFYADEVLLEDILKDRSLEQLINVSALNGIYKYALAMPDIHEGYASPIGGVAAIDSEIGIIAPGMQGYDINCGMRLIKTNFEENEIKQFLKKLAREIYEAVPSGLGKGRKIKLSDEELNNILDEGAKYLVKKGYGNENDLEFCESNGNLNYADHRYISLTAKERGRDQIGTLGSGNHFLEIQKVNEIYDEKAAQVFGLFKNQIVIMIHTGSRGLGHQVATDYIKKFVNLMPKYKINVPDQEFACVPFQSQEGQEGFKASAAAANYAWANRQMITYYIRKAIKKVFPSLKDDLDILYDVAHNIIKLETFQIEGKEKKLLIHRKGATRAFPPFHPEIPFKYQEIGQPILIPGSMGTASYILKGLKEAEESFYSVCHGAGRTMSRHEAMRKMSSQTLKEELEKKGIIVMVNSVYNLAEEAPLAYKDVNRVVEVVSKAYLAQKVIQLVPLAVIKG
jgi:tRNA-splicing ligase RtcB